MTTPVGSAATSGSTADISTASAVFFNVPSFVDGPPHFDLTPRQEVVSLVGSGGGSHGSSVLRQVAGGGPAGSRPAGGAAQAARRDELPRGRRPRHAGTVPGPRRRREVGEVGRHRQPRRERRRRARD